jgi:hypothetical protein
LNKTRLWTVTIATAALSVGSLAAATLAQAAGTLTVGAGSFTASLDTGETLSICNTSSCNPTAAIYLASTSGTYTTGSSVLFGTGSGQTGPTQLPAGTYTVAIFDSNTALVTSEPNVVIGDGGGSQPSGTASTAPVEVSLSLDLTASGASCKEGSAATGVMGSWLFLPAADDCSSTTAPNAKLLGWSTSANFPVQRAQSQVDNRWGAIDEIFDGVRMIFIPAGQATFVSGPNSLYPIWAS